MRRTNFSMHFWLLFGVFIGVVVGELQETTKHGLNKAHMAYNSACFYELYGVYRSPVDCFNDTASSYEGALEQKTDVDAIKKFGHWVEEDQLPHLPNEYVTGCSKFLEEPDSTPMKDESRALSDTKSGYPFQGFAYCIMQTLRQRHGQSAVQTATDEVIDGKLDWKEALVRRDNLFRKRHGVERFTLNEDLNRGAQEWADKLAATCMKLTHSPPNVREYKKTYVGENIAAGGTQNKLIAAYQSSNMWYREIDRYPFPKSCEETPGCPAPKKGVGHFTQTVWAETKEVGYGYAYAPKCKKYYVVGRYFPGGNLVGAQKSNVLEPKCSEFC